MGKRFDGYEVSTGRIMYELTPDWFVLKGVVSAYYPVSGYKYGLYQRGADKDGSARLHGFGKTWDEVLCYLPDGVTVHN